MAVSLPSNNMYFIRGQSVGYQVPDVLDLESAQAGNQQSRVLLGPVAILWDIENCPVPGEVRPEDVAGNIRMALELHPMVKGAVTMLSAYGDFNNFPRRLREGCQKTGINLIDVPNGRKDAADKAILVDMFLFALDNRPPSTIFLISGDVDFSHALHKLGQRGYTIVLAIPAGVGVSSALRNAGRFVWDWPSLARGEGLVPVKSFLSRAPDFSGYCVGCVSGDDSDLQNDEEAIVYRGISQNGYSIGNNSKQIYYIKPKHMSMDLTKTSHVVREYNPDSFIKNRNNVMGMHSQSTQYPAPVSRALAAYPSKSSLLQRSQTASVILPSLNKPMQTLSVTDSGQHGMPSNETNAGQTSYFWVQPGDIQGLKRQLVHLVNIYGGSLLLARVPSEYHKVFGRPLFLVEYGSYKLVNLIEKMHDVFTIEGKGNKKFLCLRELANKCIQGTINVNSSTVDSGYVIRKEEHTGKLDKGKGVQEFTDSGACNDLHDDFDAYSIEVNLATYSDEGSDNESGSEQDEEDRDGETILQGDVNAEEYAAEASLEIFKRELQELLVSHACAILLANFSTLYRQRYTKDLDYKVFGVKELEELIQKARDVAIVMEERGTKRRFVVANCGSKVD